MSSTDSEPEERQKSRRRVIWRRVIIVTCSVLAVAVVAAMVPVIAFVYHVHERNDALPTAARRALSSEHGAVSAVLILGSDRSSHRAQRRDSAFGTTDAMLLARIDTSHRRIDLLSIPRDYYIDGNRLGSAFAHGGAAGALRAVHKALKIDINHVVVIDFDGFRDVVDAIGPIRVDNPFMVRSGSNEFDGRSWTFPRGVLHLNGRGALAYARIRRVDQQTQMLNQQEVGEIGRLMRQQRVLDSAVRSLTLSTFVRHPVSMPRQLVRPVTTDIGVRDLLRWARAFVHGSTPHGLRCRLGGAYEDRDDSTYLVPDDSASIPANQVIRMFERHEPPIPPPLPTSGGCLP